MCRILFTKINKQLKGSWPCLGSAVGRVVPSPPLLLPASSQVSHPGGRSGAALGGSSPLCAAVPGAVGLPLLLPCLGGASPPPGKAAPVPAGTTVTPGSRRDRTGLQGSQNLQELTRVGAGFVVSSGRRQHPGGSARAHRRANGQVVCSRKGRAHLELSPGFQREINIHGASEETGCASRTGLRLLVNVFFKKKV